MGCDGMDLGLGIQYDVNNMGDIKQDNINRKSSDIKIY